MRNRQLAEWLRKNTGVVYVAAGIRPGTKSKWVRAVKGEVILMLEAEPDAEWWDMTFYNRPEGVWRRLWQIYLGPVITGGDA